MRTPSLASLLCGAVLALTGCTMAHPLNGNPESPYPPQTAPQVGQIIHVPTGIAVTESQMLAAASDARIVYVGETHDNPAAHRVQLAVLKAMAERWPGQISLGMEMFTPAQQPVLDSWVAGKLTEKELLKQSDWYTVWTMDFALYRELLFFARDHRIPVVGLNADKELVRLVSRKVPAEMTEEERRRLPEMDMTDPYQTALVEAIYGGHAAGENLLAGFQRVQTLWDETMADNVVRHLQSFPDGTRRMVVLAGGHHVRFGFGIPRRVFRRLPVSYLLIGSQEVEIPVEREVQIMDVTLPNFPMPPYDYVVYTRYEELPGERVKLGVRMETQDGKVVVQSVVPGSSADRGGILPGDVILSLDGEPVVENFDLVYAVGLRKKGDKATLEVLRKGEGLKLPVELQPLPSVDPHK